MSASSASCPAVGTNSITGASAALVALPGCALGWGPSVKVWVGAPLVVLDNNAQGWSVAAPTPWYEAKVAKAEPSTCTEGDEAEPRRAHIERRDFDAHTHTPSHGFRDTQAVAKREPLAPIPFPNPATEASGCTRHSV